MTRKLRLLTTVCLTLITVCSYSQKKENILIPEIPYDSTANYLGTSAAQYTGQELWLKRMPESQRDMGYANFILNYKKAADINDPKNVYKCCDGGYNSQYYELQNKRFLVEQVFKEQILGEDRLFFKLKELSSDDIVYYRYDDQSLYSFPFVVMGYIEKQKELLQDKEFVFTDVILLNSVDVVSHDPIQPAIGQKWKYCDISVDNYRFDLSLIAEGKKGVKIAIPLTDILSDELPKKVYTLKEANDMRDRFGVYNYNRILQQKIASNMNKDALKLSWGDPLEIIQRGSTEEWVYIAGSVVFSANKIIQIK